MKGKYIKISSDNETYTIMDKILVRGFSSNINETQYLCIRQSDNTVHFIHPAIITEVVFISTTW